MPHSHDHHGHGCSHEATDVDNALEMGIQYSLYSKIDMVNLECLNEVIEGSGKFVFKPYEGRLDFSKVIYCDWISRGARDRELKIFVFFFPLKNQFVQSDADEELLLNIPFTGNIKLKAMIIIGANDDSHPSRVRMYERNEKTTRFVDINVI